MYSSCNLELFIYITFFSCIQDQLLLEEVVKYAREQHSSKLTEGHKVFFFSHKTLSIDNYSMYLHPHILFYEICTAFDRFLCVIGYWIPQPQSVVHY